MNKAYYHLPGLFEFYELYSVFLPIYREHRDYFYDWCEIGSVYGSPMDCLWGGGRVELGEESPEKVLELMHEYGISARLTFSNSLITQEHLSDKKCNALCRMFDTKNSRDIQCTQKDSKEIQCTQKYSGAKDGADDEVNNGIIIYSDLLLDYIKEKYPSLYFVSSTTKVLNDFDDLLREVDRSDFKYVVPDFRLNNAFDRLEKMTPEQKGKIEFLCNECCSIACKDRKECYEEVSRKNLGIFEKEHVCKNKDAASGYRFSKAMENPEFIGIEDIKNKYLPMGFSNFKIEGRGLGSAVVLEFLLYYMTKPEYHLKVREMIYLDSMLDLF